MGVPVKPMNDAFRKASRRLLAKPYDISPVFSFNVILTVGMHEALGAHLQPSLRCGESV